MHVLSGLLDMDGVLVNFARGIAKAHGLPFPYDFVEHHGNFDMDKLWGMTKDELFKPADYDFWLNLEPMPDAHAIVDLVTARFGLENVAILSSPSENDGCMPGKQEWLKKHFPQFYRQFFFGTAKQIVAHRHAVLIDDYDRNVNAFRAKNFGQAILVPQAWNSDHPYQHRSLELVKERLDLIKE